MPLRYVPPLAANALEYCGAAAGPRSVIAAAVSFALPHPTGLSQRRGVQRVESVGLPAQLALSGESR